MKLFSYSYNHDARRLTPGAQALLCLLWALGLTLGGALSQADAAVSTLALAPLYSFGPLDGQYNSPDGASPVASLTVGGAGVLYGVTVSGGPQGAGTVFQVNPDGTGYTVLHSLDPAADGASPMGTLLAGGDGFLYGTTSDRGPGGGGTVFKLRTDGSGFTVLHTFGSNVYDGGSPVAGLTDGHDGYFYGTTSGGEAGLGMVFKIAPDGSGFTDLHFFSTVGTGISLSGGDTPLGPVLVGPGGVLYGTTCTGGDNGVGSVFTVRTDGTGFAVLYSFTGGADGGYPRAGLTAGGDGFLYGTTSDSQLTSDGSVFKIAPNGTGFATLYRFSGGADGAFPEAAVAVGQDGKLYGTTFGGGSNGAGVVFVVNSDGTGFATVASLSGTGGDGAGPSAGLTPGAQGQWYGTSYQGGPNDTGGLFVLAPAHAGPVQTGSAPPPATHAHVLWNNADGSASLWDLSDPHPAATARVYGPFAGWTAKGIADGPDGKVRIQWNRSDGVCQVWTVDAQNNVTATYGFGPFAGWTAKGIAVGPDGKVRIQWNRSDGLCQVWTVDAQSNVTASPGYGPFAGWTAKGIAVGADGNTLVQWNRSDSACQIWTLDPSGSHTASPVYSLAAGWNVTSLTN